MKNDKKYEQARKRVKAKIGFFIHLIIYVLVNGLLISINLIQSNGTIWSAWPMPGWGIGLFCHGLGVFVISGFSEITEQMIQNGLTKNSYR